MGTTLQSHKGHLPQYYIPYKMATIGFLGSYKSEQWFKAQIQIGSLAKVLLKVESLLRIPDLMECSVL